MNVGRARPAGIGENFSELIVDRDLQLPVCADSKQKQLGTLRREMPKKTSDICRTTLTRSPLTVTRRYLVMLRITSLFGRRVGRKLTTHRLAVVTFGLRELDSH